MSNETYAATTEFEVRQRSDGGVTVEGHAAVFNRYSENLGGFVEQVAPTAFRKTVNEADVRALIDHDSRLILGRSASGTLRLSTDQVGLAYQVDMPDTSYARDLLVSMDRGDLNQSSFGFRVIDDEWGFTDQGFPLRTLREVSLHNGDVSVVTYPAYPQTDANLALRSLATAKNLDIDFVTRAAKDGDLADIISGKVTPDSEESNAAAELAPPKLLALNARLLDLKKKAQPPRGR